MDLSFAPRVLKYGFRIFHKNRMKPLYMIHFITENCNANCDHCLCGDKNYWFKDELSLDEIEKFSRSLGDMLFVFLTGGEPFLRPDIAEIAKIYYTNNRVKKFQIPSNGSMGERQVKAAREMAKACPKAHVGITISLDGVGELHDRERHTPGLFKRATETFKGLQEVEKEFPNFNCNITTCITQNNQHHLRELHDFVVYKLKAKNYFNTLTRGAPTNPQAKNIQIGRFREFSDWQDDDLRANRVNGYRRFFGADFINAKNLISRRMIAKIFETKKYQIPCYTGDLSFVIKSRGEIYPCELLEKPMGYLREVDYDLMKIWYSPRADEVRRFIRDTKCFCTHECFMTLNILFNPRMWPQLLYEWGRIKLGRLTNPRKPWEATPEPAGLSSKFPIVQEREPVGAGR